VGVLVRVVAVEREAEEDAVEDPVRRAEVLEAGVPVIVGVAAALPEEDAVALEEHVEEGVEKGELEKRGEGDVEPETEAEREPEGDFQLEGDAAELREVEGEGEGERVAVTERVEELVAVEVRDATVLFVAELEEVGLREECALVVAVPEVLKVVAGVADLPPELDNPPDRDPEGQEVELEIELSVPDEVEDALRIAESVLDVEEEDVALKEPVVEEEARGDSDALAQPLAVPKAVLLPELDDEPVLVRVPVEVIVAADDDVTVTVVTEVRDDVPVGEPALEVVEDTVDFAEPVGLKVGLPVLDEVGHALEVMVGELEEEEKLVALEDPEVDEDSSDDGDALAQPLVVPDAVPLPEAEDEPVLVRVPVEDFVAIDDAVTVTELDDEPVLEGVAVDDRVAVDVEMAVKVPNDVRDDVPVVAPVLLVSAVFE
jgi:hypothetical protein